MSQRLKVGLTFSERGVMISNGERDTVNIRERLRQLLIEKVLSKGTFSLSSGAISHYYYDGKMATLDPEGISMIAELFLAEAQKCNVDAIGGLEIGAIPIATAVSQLSYKTDKPIRSFIVRKVAKEHGTHKRIEGPLRSGDRVMIVDDVVTTGSSVLQAIEEVEREGCRIVEVLALVDRLEGARERLKNYPFGSLYTRKDLGVSDEYLVNTEEANTEWAVR